MSYRRQIRAKPNASPRKQPLWRRYGPRQWMLLLAVLSQLATVAITWEVWNLRDQPVNLPLLPLPAVSFGALVVISLLAVLFWPRRGLVAHAVVVAVACVFDQYRMQPQFFSLIVLMAACVFDQAVWFARWYLAAMWIWAGLHKLLSAEWLGHMSWAYLDRWGLPGDDFYLAFAIVVAASELVLGALAILVPRRAAYLCLLIHLGILLSLSPWGVNHNESVWPWNLATAIVGAWILRRDAPKPRTWLWYVTIAVLLVPPVGFYFGLLNAHLSFVLYSGNMPRALHIAQDSVKRLDGWGALTVPFPDSPRLFVQVFQTTASPGDKLYVADPRRWLKDRYFIKRQDGSVLGISRDRFYQADMTTGEVGGVEFASPNGVWRLARSGVFLKRDDRDLIYSATVQDRNLDDEQFQLLGQLPNLLELKLANTNINDYRLRAIARLRRLNHVEINSGTLTDRCLVDLAKLRTLRWLHLEQVDVTGRGLDALSPLEDLKVLLLPGTKVDDRGLADLRELRRLQWLDVSGTHVTSDGLASLRELKDCQSLNLSDTQVDDRGLRHLHSLTNLEFLQLARTKITDDGLAHLADLQNCRFLNLEHTSITDAGLDLLAVMRNLKMLKLRGARVTAQGIRKLERALPGCDIDW